MWQQSVSSTPSVEVISNHTVPFMISNLRRTPVEKLVSGDAVMQYFSSIHGWLPNREGHTIVITSDLVFWHISVMRNNNRLTFIALQAFKKPGVLVLRVQNAIWSVTDYKIIFSPSSPQYVHKHRKITRLIISCYSNSSLSAVMLQGHGICCDIRRLQWNSTVCLWRKVLGSLLKRKHQKDGWVWQ